MKTNKIMTASVICAAVLLSGCKVEVKVPSASEATSQTENSTATASTAAATDSTVSNAESNTDSNADSSTDSNADSSTDSNADSNADSSVPAEADDTAPDITDSVDMSTAKTYLSEIEADGTGKKFTYTTEVPGALKLSETLTYDGSDKFTGSSQRLELMRDDLRFYDAAALLGVSEWASLFKEEATGVYDTGIQPAGSFGYPADSPLYTGGIQSAYSTYTDLVALANAMQSVGGDISFEYSDDIDFSDAEIIIPEGAEVIEPTDENG